MMVNWDKLWHLLPLFVFFITMEIAYAQASFEDARCRCVCPQQNNSKNSQTVYIDANHDTTQCTCELVVTVENKKEFCPKCECKFESRNTTTIKVVVIIIICVISLLLVYMLFLLCLEPVIVRSPRYQRHTDEEISQPMLDEPTISRLVEPGLGSRQRSILNRVQDEQKKWKGTVLEQRKNIYDRHSMLN